MLLSLTRPSVHLSLGLLFGDRLLVQASERPTRSADRRCRARASDFRNRSFVYSTITKYGVRVPFGSLSRPSFLACHIFFDKQAILLGDFVRRSLSVDVSP